MQIILKQRDIELALKGYIAAQGIILANKTVEINFTAGRKESGISAEVDIDEIMPISTVNTRPGTVAVSNLRAVSFSPEVESTTEDAPAAPVEADETVEGTTPPVATGTSLFS